MVIRRATSGNTVFSLCAPIDLDVREEGPWNQEEALESFADCAGGRPQTHGGRPAIEAKDAEPGEVRHTRCMTEILASPTINALSRKGFNLATDKGG